MNNIAKSVINLACDVIGKTIDKNNENVLMFSVLAGIVIKSMKDNSTIVLSIATGTKCIGYDTAMKYRKGSILFDSHAEVLARRGFIHYILKLIIEIQKNPKLMESDDCILEYNSINEKYILKNGLQLHMYVSDPPCGDCTIYQLDVKGNNGNFNDNNTRINHSNSSYDFNFTGAKLLVNDDDKNDDDKNNNQSTSNSSTFSEVHSKAYWIREVDQMDITSLGRARLKPMRSDIPLAQQTRSMCCSDKLCRWHYLGLHGAMLAPLVEANSMRLRGLIVSHDQRASKTSQMNAMRRTFQRGFLYNQYKIQCTKQKNKERGEEEGRPRPRPRDKNREEREDTQEKKKQKIEILEIEGGNDISGSSILKTNVDADLGADLELELYDERWPYSKMHIDVLCHEAINESVNKDFVNMDKNSNTKKNKKQNISSIKTRPSGQSMNWIKNVPMLSKTNSCSNTNTKSDGDVGRGSKVRTIDVRGGTVEVTQALTGILLGATLNNFPVDDSHVNSNNNSSNNSNCKEDKRVKGKSVRNFESRLCRRSLTTLASQATRDHHPSAVNGIWRAKEMKEKEDNPKSGSSGNNDHDIAPGTSSYTSTCTYSDWKREGKRACLEYTQLRREFLSQEPFHQWICDNLDEEDFHITIQ